MKDIWKNRGYRTMGLVAFVAVFATGCATAEKRDLAAQLAVARTTVAGAVSAGASDFASVELKAAQENLDLAEKAAQGNDYKNATGHAEKAQVNAQLATTKARAAKAQQAVDALNESNRALQDEMNRTSK
jgi:hypothetical protein